LGMTPSRPKRLVKLGDTKLLTMGMTEAAGYWGIPSPISKRDKKSGIKKRTQQEIEQSRLRP
jgi:DNA (cytosine-5)-methyltransferase 1